MVNIPSSVEILKSLGKPTTSLPPEKKANSFAAQPKIPSSKEILESIKNPKAKPIIKTSTPTEPTKTFFSGVDEKGTYGYADEKDISGRPFFAYRKPGDTATTTDKTRVATEFDPRIPSKVTRDDFYNPRAEDLREAFKNSMGISYSEELDHKIALALSGSNDESNLRSIPKEKNNDADIIRTLQQDVIDGRKSLFQAQIELAEAKNLPLPWTGEEEKKNFFKNFAEYFKDDSPAGIVKNTVKGIFEIPGKAVLKGVEKVGEFLDPTKEIEVRTPFSKEPAKLPYGGGAVKTAIDLSTAIAEAPFRGATRAVKEWGDAINQLQKNLGFKPTNFKPITESAPAEASYPDYESTNQKIQRKIANGDGVLSAYIGGISESALDVAVGAQVASQAMSFLSKLLSPSLNPFAQIEAYKTLDYPKTLKDAEKTFKKIVTSTTEKGNIGALNKELYQNAKNALDILRKDGIPSSSSFKQTSSKYLEWLSRQTNLGQFNMSSKFNFTPSGESVFKSNLKVNAVPKPEWKPVMIEKEAQNFSKGSELQGEFYHGADPATIAKIKKGGFVPSSDFPGNGLISLSDDPKLAANYGNVVKVRANVRNVRTFQSPAEYEASITAETAGSSAGAKERALTNAYDAIVVKNGLGQGKDMILVNDPKALTVISESVAPSTASTVAGTEGGEIAKSFAKRYEGEEDISTKILEDLKGRETVSKQYILDATNRGDLKQAERDLIREVLNDYPDGDIPVQEFANKVKQELLPLERGTTADIEKTREPGETKYENITLPEDLRGKVTDYTEHVYESPIPTSAGGIHFDKEINPNYFAHTRIEDVPGNIRRVIEMQSDLFQKDRLQYEKTKVEPEIIDYTSGERKVTPYRKIDRSAEVAKLEPYRNTWQDRIIREEVKQAAIDGKTKLQFPTGETAMKIEGLGNDTGMWYNIREDGNTGLNLKIEDLKVGKEIKSGPPGNWIITEVLGDGKFKAMSKSQLDQIKQTYNTTIEDILKGDYKGLNFSRNAETFDISGKIDTSNPIYKFYEKEVGRYLTNKYGAKKITDPQGVSWYEIAVKPEYAKQPVMAFKKTSVPDLEGPKVKKEKLGELVDMMIKERGYDPENKKLIARVVQNLIDMGDGSLAKGRFYQTRLGQNVVEALEKNGFIEVLTAFHETGHYVMETLMSKASYAKALEQAKKDLRLLQNQKLNSDLKRAGYKTEDERAKEYLVEKWAKELASKKGFSSKYKSFFEKFTDALKRFVRAIKDVIKRFKKAYDETPNKQGGSINFGAEFRPKNQLSKEARDAFAEFKNMSKGEKITDPDRLINSGVSMPNEVRKIIGAKTAEVSLLRKPIKHIAEKGAIGERLFESIPEIIGNPDELRQSKPRAEQKRFLFVKELQISRDQPISSAVVELRQEGDSVVITAFPTNNDYLQSFDLLWRSPKALEKPVPPYASRKSEAARRGEVSALREDQKIPVKESISQPDEVIKPTFREIEAGEKELKKVEAKQSKEIKEKLKFQPFEEKISELTTVRDQAVEAIKSNPAQELTKYISKTTGRLPEVTGKPTMRSLTGSGIEVANSEFGMRGDDIVTEYGFSSVDDAQKALDDLAFQKKRVESYQEEITRVRKDLAQARLEDKDAKSLEFFLNRSKSVKEIEEKLAQDARAKARAKTIQKATEEARERLEAGLQKDREYQQKVLEAKVDSQKESGLYAKIKQSLYPLKALDPVSKRVTEEWINALVQAKNAGQETYIDFFKKGPQTMEEIHEFQAGKPTGYIRDAFDEMGTDFKRRGLEFEWLEDNYAPQVWMSNSNFRRAAIEKLKAKGLTMEEIESYLAGEPLPEDKAIRLKLRPYFVKTRFWESYAEGMRHGLKPKFSQPAQLIGYYKQQGEEALANLAYIQKLKQEGRLLYTEDAPDNWVPITKLFSKEPLSAPPILARMINGRFRDEANLPLGASIKKFGAATARLLFDLKTMSGVPYSTINSFAIGQAVKLTASLFGDIATFDAKAALTDLKSMFAFIRANSNSATRTFFEENKPYLAKAAENGLDLFHIQGSYQDVGRKLTDFFVEPAEGAGIFGKTKTKIGNIGRWLGIGFKRAFTAQTNANFLPMVTLQTFKDVYSSALKKGMQDRDASRFASQVTKNFMGIIGDVGRGLETNDTINTLFAAPYFRESVLHTLWNASKGWSVSFGDPTFYKSRKLLLGMVIMYALYNLLNHKLNGHFMWDNPPGREWQLRIENGESPMYVDFLPSFFAIARNLGSGTINLFRGNFDVATQKFGSLFSMPVSITTEVIANKDYFGRPIYAETDEAPEKLKKVATFVGLSTTHPYILELQKYFTGQQGLYQALTRMAELPIKYGNLSTEQKSEYYNMLDEQTQKRANAKKKIKPIYDELQALKAEGQIEEATRRYNDLSDEDRMIYDQIKSDEKRKATNARKPAIQDIYDTNQELIANGELDKATEIYEALSEEDRRIYGLVKKASQKRLK